MLIRSGQAWGRVLAREGGAEVRGRSRLESSPQADPRCDGGSEAGGGATRLFIVVV